MMLLEIERHMLVLDGRGRFNHHIIWATERQTLFEHSAKIYLDSLQRLTL
jgi:hypothetical protein